MHVKVDKRIQQDDVELVVCKAGAGKMGISNKGLCGLELIKECDYTDSLMAFYDWKENPVG